MYIACSQMSGQDSSYTSRRAPEQDVARVLKVSMVNIDDDATNVSDTVQTIGVSEASVANPNISID